MDESQSDHSEPEHTGSQIKYELFVSLFADQHRSLYLYIASLVPNSTVADDVFQETSVILWRRFTDYDSSKPFAAWARGIALNQARKARREHSDRRLVFSDELVEVLAREQQSREDLSERRRLALEGCMKKLRRTDRDLIRRCYHEEAAFKDVAEDLKRSVGAVYQALSRIRRSLFDCIEKTIAREDRA